MRIDLGIRPVVLLTATFFAAAGSASAQVGLSSGTQQVALLVRVPPRASLLGVIPIREKVTGSLRETSVRVRLTANTGYRLLVRVTATNGARVWVRATDGLFQELVVGTPVTVAQNHTGTEECEQEVNYRIQSESAAQPAPSLPMVYEIVVDPAL